jgi:N6-L-threonylcarbamoyladenine synthase
MIILGIETSCDETAVALVTEDKMILADCVLSQLEEHKPYGGVVPEIAARAHLVYLPQLASKALEESQLSLDMISAFAATGGPGLIGGVMVGVSFAKALSLATGKPFIAVNHLEGHALTARLCSQVQFPYLLLLVSGGHCQFLIVEAVGHYRKLGTTIDDAAGEAFDKVAKMLDLGYPGGPAVQKWAEKGDPTRFSFPRPMKGREGCDLSFSGLKNAVRIALSKFGGSTPLSDQNRSDLAASFQKAVVDSLEERLSKAIAICRRDYPQIHDLVAAGGVAANHNLRKMLETSAQENNFSLILPPAKLCTDNAAMIAWAGIEKYRLGHRDGLDFSPRPRWPLEGNV